MIRKKKASMIGNKIEDEKAPEANAVSEENYVERVNLSRSENHCHP